MGKMGVLLFVLASGFTTAGLVAAMHETVSDTNADFRLSFANPLSTIWSVFVCLFAGPYIVIKNAAVYWLSGALPGMVMIFCVGLSLLWSFCSGVFVVEAIKLPGIIIAALR